MPLPRWVLVALLALVVMDADGGASWMPQLNCSDILEWSLIDFYWGLLGEMVGRCGVGVVTDGCELLTKW